MPGAIMVVCTDGSGITAATTGELLAVDVDVLRYVIVFAFQSHQKRSNHQETGGNRKSFVQWKNTETNWDQDQQQLLDLGGKWGAYSVQTVKQDR